METMKIHRKNIEIFEEIIENPRNPMVNLFRNLSKAKLAAAQREIERRSGFRSSAEVVAEVHFFWDFHGDFW